MAKIATPQSKNGIRKTSESRSISPRSTGSHQGAEIEKLAYQFYVERGYQDGYHEQDWLRAEAIVRGRSRS